MFFKLGNFAIENPFESMEEAWQKSAQIAMQPNQAGDLTVKFQNNLPYLMLKFYLVADSASNNINILDFMKVLNTLDFDEMLLKNRKYFEKYLSQWETLSWPIKDMLHYFLLKFAEGIVISFLKK